MPELDIFDEDLTRSRFLKRAGAALAIPTALGSIAGTARAAEARGDADIDTLRWAYSATIQALDNHIVHNTTIMSAMRVGAESLIAYGPDNKLQGALATSWKQDNEKVVFQIRKNVKYWDGSPMTAEDVRFNLARALQSTSRRAAVFVNVSDVKVTGTWEVTVYLKSPDPLLVPQMTSLYVLKPSLVQELGAKSGSYGSGTLMGTGPFRITSFSTSGLSGVRNANYWGKKPIAKNIEVKIIPDSNTQQLALQSGQIDGTFDIPFTQLDRIRSYANVILVSGFQFYSFVYNVNQAPFDDVNFRRALAYCIPRESMTKAFLAKAGTAQPHGIPAPRASWKAIGMSDAAINAFLKSLPTYTFNLQKAKAALAQSKGQGASFTITGSSAVDPVTIKMAEALAANVAKIGLKAEIRDWPSSQYFGLSTNVSGVWPLLANVPTADPGFILGDGGLIANKNGAPSGANFSKYVNRTVQQLQVNIRVATTEKGRIASLQQLARIMASELPSDTCFFPKSGMILSKKLNYPGYSAFQANASPWCARIEPAA